jgi:hypothetical protein
MSYDTTGPVKVNETKSLLLLILLVVLVAGGIWTALKLNKPAPTPAPAQPQIVTPPAQPPARAASTPTSTRRGPGAGRLRVPPRNQPDGITRPRENVALVKAGSVYVTILTHRPERPPVVSRTRPHMFSAIQRIINDPKAAEHYDAMPEQIAELKPLNLKVPPLSEAQQKTLTELFNAIQAAKPEDRPALEKNLVEAARKMTFSRDEQKAYDETIEKARDIFRTDQLDLIDNGR